MNGGSIALRLNHELEYSFRMVVLTIVRQLVIRQLFQHSPIEIHSVRKTGLL
jgi:hypothetical protein